MKFLLALITVFFLAATLQAQIPYDVNNLQPYYPGAIMQPYYPQAYYPQPYSVLTPYASNPISITDNTLEVDRLTRQVQQLTDQVMQLQAQLASVQNQQTAQAAELYAPQREEPSTPVVLVFK